MEGQGVSCCFGLRRTCWFYVLVRVDASRNRKWRVVDAQILGVLRLLGAVSAVDVVFYERVSIYLEDYYLFLLSVLYSRRANVEIKLDGSN